MKNDRSYQAFRILQIAFIIAPIAAGLDKFFMLLTQWEQYLSPMALNYIGEHALGFMRLVGVVEIIAGIGMIFKPQVFSYIISLWLLCIVINLLALGHHFDVALRDVGLMLCAYACGRLSTEYAKT